MTSEARTITIRESDLRALATAIVRIGNDRDRIEHAIRAAALQCSPLCPQTGPHEDGCPVLSALTPPVAAEQSATGIEYSDCSRSVFGKEPSPVAEQAEAKEPKCVAEFVGSDGTFTCDRAADSLYHRCTCEGGGHAPLWNCHPFVPPAPVADAEPEREAAVPACPDARNHHLYTRCGTCGRGGALVADEAGVHRARLSAPPVAQAGEGEALKAGAEPRGTCDWGGCDGAAVAWRMWQGGWLPVCRDHADCDHRQDRGGKVICDCFVLLFISKMHHEGYEDADLVSTIVHDVDNELATRRASAPALDVEAMAREIEAMKDVRAGRIGIGWNDALDVVVKKLRHLAAKEICTYHCYEHCDGSGKHATPIANCCRCAAKETRNP